MTSNRVHVHLADEDLGVFDFERVTLFDSVQIEAKSGLTTKAFIDGLAEMRGVALQALVWLLRSRKGAVTDLRAINFAIGDLRMEAEPDPTTPSSGDVAAAISASSPTSAI